MRYVEVPVKSALSPSKLADTDYALNPYVGCEHRCVYCYSPYVLGLNPKEWGKVVKVRRMLPNLIPKETKRKKGRVLLSSVTDAYQPAEKRYHVTRHCLEQLLKADVDISILTKSSLVLRDIDVIPCFSQAEVGVTITTLDEDIREVIEPNASPITERLKVIKKFSSTGVRTYAFLGPLIPYLHGNIGEIISVVADAGADYIIADKLRIKQGMWSSLAPILTTLEPKLGEFLQQEKYYRSLKLILKKHSHILPIFLEF